ncbi:MAG: autotransporter-associated beta strand repeat-containing protein, partial [Thermoguttaceae bacterium]|nr:autotransporter-associated beta strand repeat-containing protein [Thermoguttaceae bacterium]
AQGIITQTGGTVSFTTSGATDVRIGHWPNTGYPSRYDISGGSLSVPNTTTYLGWDGYAELNISGGEVSLKCLSLSNSGNGKGTLRLTGGTLNVGDGGVVRNKRNASGPAAAQVDLGQGTVNATATQTWGNNLTMTLTGRSATDSEDVEGGVTTFNADEGKTITIPSVIAGVGALTKTGAGTLTLSGANTYTGGTTVTAGTLKLTNSSTTGTGTTTVASGATLEIAAPSTAWTWSGGNINGNGTLKVTGGNLTMPFANMGLGTDGKIVADGANFTIDNKQSATVYYKGVDIDINNGSTVTIKRSGSSDQIWLQNEPVITFDANGGGTFNTGTSLNLVNNSNTKFVTKGGAKNTITGAAGFNLHSHNLTFEVAKGTDASGVDLEVSARLWNGHGISKTGAGTMSLTYANPYQGGTTISAGTLMLSGNGTMGTGSVSVASGAMLTFADGLTTTAIPNAISGAGKLVKQGTNTVSINGANTFTGDVAINGGTLSFLMNGTNTNLNVAKISGAGDLALRISNGAGNIQMPNLTLDNFSGEIALVNNDCTDSSKFYTNRRTFEGFTFAVNPGTTIYVEYAEFMANVLLAGDGNREGYGALRINDNMSGKITVTQDALLGINGSRTVSGDITSGAASGEVALKIQTNTNNVSQTISGNISDGENSALGLSIIKKQNGTFSFTGNLTYTGATSVAEGQTMALSGANTNLLHSRAVDVNGTLNFTGYTGTDTMQLNDLTGTNGMINGTGKNLTLFNDEPTKFTGSITAAQVTKTGEGTLKLDGTVTASSLTVTGGELDLKGSTTGGLTISGAVFSPGNSVGAAEVGGAFTLTDGASVLMEIGGSAPTQNDSLVATGDLELGDGKIYLTLAQACDLKPGDEFTAVFSGRNSASLTNLVNEHVVSQYFTNLAYVPYGGEGQYAITGILDPNAVPEPATWALLLLGTFGLMYWRKRK